MVKKKSPDLEEKSEEETGETLDETSEETSDEISEEISEEENSEEENSEEDGIEEGEGKTPPKKFAGIFDSVEDLEKAYRETSTEGQRLGGVVKTFRELVQKDDVLRERLQEQLGIKPTEEKSEDYQSSDQSVIPPEDRLALDQIKAEQEQKNKQTWFKFIEKRPDFQKPEMVESLEKVIPAIVEGGKKIGKTYTFNEILNVAANIIQPEEKETMIDDAGIDTGSVSRRTSKPKSDVDLSDQEREMAESLGLTEKEYREGKKLRKS
jgi:regulator of replication initiation timing